ncbi:hypothetical protein PGQ11_009854 [Apiospora arundinis]|uniref:Secreted protein n=1 Tax=Apiospora arundinis TaxID=335852 RepID=A0ABR2I812_9PEZI
MPPFNSIPQYYVVFILVDALACPGSATPSRGTGVVGVVPGESRLPVGKPILPVLRDHQIGTPASRPWLIVPQSDESHPGCANKKNGPGGTKNAATRTVSESGQPPKSQLTAAVVQYRPQVLGAPRHPPLRRPHERDATES